MLILIKAFYATNPVKSGWFGSNVPVAVKLYYPIHIMRGSDILFSQCWAKNSTHLVYGLQGKEAQKHHYPRLMFWYFKSPITSLPLAAGNVSSVSTLKAVGIKVLFCHIRLVDLRRLSKNEAAFLPFFWTWSSFISQLLSVKYMKQIHWLNATFTEVMLEIRLVFLLS